MNVVRNAARWRVPAALVSGGSLALLGGVVAIAAPGGTTATSPAAAVEAGPSSDPAGNNGVIKIEDENIDDIPQNDPHVGCVF
ncbi:MAG: hypothetical protein ACRDP9_17035, partial [Kribbellaceae bacterium]